MVDGRLGELPRGRGGAGGYRRRGCGTDGGALQRHDRPALPGEQAARHRRTVAGGGAAGRRGGLHLLLQPRAANRGQAERHRRALWLPPELLYRRARRLALCRDAGAAHDHAGARHGTLLPAGLAHQLLQSPPGNVHGGVQSRLPCTGVYSVSAARSVGHARSWRVSLP